MQNTLKPAIKKGSNYNKVIPKVGCEKTQLGLGDTFHTVNQMKQWVKTKNWQVAKLAPLLKRGTAQQTVIAVHKFLNDHLPYKADGALQQIASPACAWHSREKNGFDCKTFSVFASCLLTQLGIPHAIRQVRQYNFRPNIWTHVYVVVPHDPKDTKIEGAYWVCDGTVKDNKESYIVEKKDEFMELQHVGLGRSCPSTTKVAPSMYGAHPVSTGTMQKTYFEFLRFFNLLLKCGVSPHLVNQIKAELDKSLQARQIPRIKICGTAMGINGRVFYFNQGLNGIKDEASNFLKNTIEDAKADVTGKAEGWINEIFTKIGDFFKCIGSSATPATAKKLIDNSIGYLWTSRMNNIGSLDPKNDTGITQKFDILNRDLAVSRAYFDFHASESRDCGRKANQSVADFVRKLEQKVIEIVDIMRYDYDITITPKNIIASDPSTNGVSSMTHEWKGRTISVSYPYITFKLKPGSQGNIPIGGGGSSISNGSTNSGPTRGGGFTSTSTGVDTRPAFYQAFGISERLAYDVFVSGGIEGLVNWAKANQRRISSLRLPFQQRVGITNKELAKRAGFVLDNNGSAQLPAPATQQAGGGLVTFIIGSLVAGKLYSDYKKKKKTTTNKRIA